MSSDPLPSAAALRRSLARRRVRDLREEHPVLEWLFGRLLVTENALRDACQRDTEWQRACARVLWANGYETNPGSSALAQEAASVAFGAAGTALDEHEKPSLLLVDDDQLLLRATRRVLDGRFRVSISPSPTLALHTLKAHSIDVIVADYEIPSTKGGVWLLEQARDRFPNVGRILISSRAVPQEVLDSDAVHQFVHKNAGLEELIRCISECLETSKTAGHPAMSAGEKRVAHSCPAHDLDSQLQEAHDGSESKGALDQSQ